MYTQLTREQELAMQMHLRRTFQSRVCLRDDRCAFPGSEKYNFKDSYMVWSIAWHGVRNVVCERV